MTDRPNRQTLKVSFITLSKPLNTITTITLMVITIIAVTRKHTEKLNDLSSYTLIYGRRKVGKTFLVKNFIDHDLYFIVKRGGGIIAEDDSITNIDSFDLFLEKLSPNSETIKPLLWMNFKGCRKNF